MSPRSAKPKKGAPGFTLAELLIALLILGIIATFTIPKILASQQNTKNAAVFRESIAALSATIEQGRVYDGMTDANMGIYVLAHMNAVKLCSSNASTQGCWDTTTQGTVAGNNQGQAGLVLHNGAVIVGLDNCCGHGFGGMATNEAQNDLEIDINGTAGPNQDGQDQFPIIACFGMVRCTTWMTGNPSMISVPAAAQQAFFQ